MSGTMTYGGLSGSLDQRSQTSCHVFGSLPFGHRLPVPGRALGSLVIMGTWQHVGLNGKGGLIGVMVIGPP